MTTDVKKEKAKELKTLLDSYTAVAHHKLGRLPTIEELTKMIDEHESQPSTTVVASRDLALTPKPSPAPVIDKMIGDSPAARAKEEPTQEVKGYPRTEPELMKGADEQPADSSEPAILRYVVYYGRSGDKPDASHILFYKDPTLNRWYDCEKKQWSSDQASWMDHLPSRPITASNTDLISAIASGVMTPGEFGALSAHGILTPDARRLGGMVGLSEEKMEKSQSEEDSEEDTELDVEPATEQIAETTDDSCCDDHDEVTGDDQLKAILDGIGLNSSSSIATEDQGSDESEVTGDDVFSEIIALAVAEAQGAMSQQITSLIRSEIQKAFAQLGIDVNLSDAMDDMEFSPNEDGEELMDDSEDSEIL